MLCYLFDARVSKSRYHGCEDRPHGFETGCREPQDGSGQTRNTPLLHLHCVRCRASGDYGGRNAACAAAASRIPDHILPLVSGADADTLGARSGYPSGLMSRIGKARHRSWPRPGTSVASPSNINVDSEGMTMHGYDYTDDDTILDEEARTAAKRAGLLAVRSSRGIGGPNNAGAFMLINPSMNAVVGTHRRRD